ncbi:MAG: hypothetical protein CL590_06450 [Alteromonadaceae bacterium]|nr:hypothetical protein [Alteromonadaceae bacterium]|tara:strand:+ start:1075 stop:1671 length:597 start_codon:yes stop_codon:yes gene_type:complete
MQQQPNLIFEQQLSNYFREQLEELANMFEPSPQEDTLWYIGNLLARFGNSSTLYSYQDGRFGVRPLALLYKDALDTPIARQRCLFLRQLGDLALFIGALFPQNYARRGIKKDYFVGMGTAAYDYLSIHARDYQHVFAELATTFHDMLELVARAGNKQQGFDMSDILAVYERWRKSGDPFLASQLAKMGIQLNPDTTSQ